jgi:hypothetical protein
MKRTIHFFRFAFLTALLAVFSAKGYISDNPKGRYTSKVFTNVTVTKSVKFGSNINPLNNNTATDLFFDVYEPAGDTCSARPCVVSVHGGGFVSGDRTGQAVDATGYAQYGYVAVSPEYRMWGTENDAAHKIWPSGFVVADQDVRACIRYLRAHASTYRIDTALIAIQGCSAGAFIALNVAYMDKPSKIPSVVDTNIYGGIEGKSGTPGFNSRVCASVGNSGAFLDTGWIEGTSPPYCGYQSTPDGWGVPTDTGTPYEWTYWLFYGITPISVRLTHMGILSGTLIGTPGSHCPANCADSSHMFLYNAICEVGRKSGTNTNVALSKTATQSSTYANENASRAIDGNSDGIAANGSVSITNSNAQAWWQVDCGAVKIIDSICTYNRTDSSGNRETNYDVKFGVDGVNWETCAYERGTMKSPSKYSFRGGILGRYVRLQLRGTNSLQLAEVQVWGRDTAGVSGVVSYENQPSSGRKTSSRSALFVVKTESDAFSTGSSFESYSGTVEVFNLSGKLVRNGVVRDGRIRMNDNHGIKSGIYLVRFGAR